MVPAAHPHPEIPKVPPPGKKYVAFTKLPNIDSDGELELQVD